MSHYTIILKSKIRNKFRFSFLGICSFYLLFQMKNFAQINWNEYVLADNYEQASTVFTIDIDNDGDIDILSASGTGTELTWWENHSNTYLSRNVLCDTISLRSVFAIDLEQDDDIDILCASYTEDYILW